MESYNTLDCVMRFYNTHLAEKNSLSINVVKKCCCSVIWLIAHCDWEICLTNSFQGKIPLVCYKWGSSIIYERAFEEASTTVCGESLFFMLLPFFIFWSITGEGLMHSLYARLIFWKWSVSRHFVQNGQERVCFLIWIASLNYPVQLNTSSSTSNF